MTDTPIAHRKDGSPIYDNTPTVVCILAKKNNQLITVRRAFDPGAGLIGLPGGYHMRGESWQQAGCRELREETGHAIQPNFIKPVSVETDEYLNNVIIGLATIEPALDPKHVKPDEVEEVVYFDMAGSEFQNNNIWAFPLHYIAAIKLLKGHIG